MLSLHEILHRREALIHLCLHQGHGAVGEVLVQEDALQNSTISCSSPCTTSTTITKHHRIPTTSTTTSITTSPWCLNFVDTKNAVDGVDVQRHTIY